MPRTVRGGLIQATLCEKTTSPVAVVKKAMIEKHVALIADAAQRGAGRLPARAVLRSLLLRRAGIAVVRIDRARAGWPDDPAYVRPGQEARHRADRAGLRGRPDRRLLQHGGGDRCRRNVSRQVPQDAHSALCPGFWEKFYFRPGNLGYPVFETRVGKVGVYICYDRHFPEGARCLGLNGAEIVFNPSATVAGLSEYLWKLEQPAHAVANGYFVGAINRPGFEDPWRIGEFYGQSYFCDPRGQILRRAAATATTS